MFQPNKTIYVWFKEFRDKDKAPEKAASSVGRPRTTLTAELTSLIEELIRDDPQMSIRIIAEYVEADKSTVHRILIEDLVKRNVSEVWVPHALSQEQMAARVNCAKHIRSVFFQEGMESFCNKLVVQDESWI